MNPRFYKATDINKANKNTAQKIWTVDNDKIQMLKSKGYEVIVIWEYDWNNTTELIKENLQRCLKQE
ncbi:MAG TPA: hypothetical protein PLY35_10385 [Thermotogota bacterium]|nr:hypothetical protein [Thermotogota bacterium]